jgi:hypothetical protein
MTTPGPGCAPQTRTIADYVVTEPRATNRSVLNSARA